MASALLSNPTIISSSFLGQRLRILYTKLIFAGCIIFGRLLIDKSKSLPRAAIFGFGALVVGWISGLLIPLILSSLLQPTWTLELLTLLVAYIFLFLACTFLK